MEGMGLDKELEMVNEIVRPGRSTRRGVTTPQVLLGMKSCIVENDAERLKKIYTNFPALYEIAKDRLSKTQKAKLVEMETGWVKGIYKEGPNWYFPAIEQKLKEAGQ
jgi:hypothetical protein